MSAQNGHGPLRLGDLTPDTRPVHLERGGQTVTLTAFVDGPRCPGYVKALVAKARDRYSAVVYVDGPDGERTFTDDPVAWDDYLRTVLLAVVEGLTSPEAEVLAGNQALAVETLRALGWVRSVADDAAPEADGEAAAATSTTGASSPDSPQPTGSARTPS